MILLSVLAIVLTMMIYVNGVSVTIDTKDGKSG